MRLEGKVAMVTGAGSGTGPNQGIGKAFCKRFLEEGARVVIGELEEGRGKEVVEDLGALGDISFVQLDVTSRASTRDAAAQVIGTHEHIDILVNNAGIYGDMGRVMAEVAGDDDPRFTFLERVMSVNMMGLWIMSSAVVPHMSRRRSGRIVNISSDAAFIYTGGLGEDDHELPDFAYGWSKWNVVGLTRFMAGALGSKNITVNCIAPGITMSDATREGMGQGAPGETLADVMTQNMTALKRTLDPDDIAATALHLVSDDGSLITGQTISVDAGLVIGHG
jgi:NAD(P)-dependent dehydrogenase (short-subunit alcohol dehydrogenase family)